MKDIDNNQDFDWGKTSKTYGKYRDIYPSEFYQKLLDNGIGLKGQKILDLGTGTGVLPRSMYEYGPSFIGTDASYNQIEQARELASNMDIAFFVSKAEEVNFPDKTFDCITACQCFYYFDSEVLMPKLYRMLKSHGKVAIVYMGWLSLESEIAYKTEDLILKYNPLWTGCREERHKIVIPKGIEGLFDIKYEEVYDLSIPFTRDSWNGRMKSCRGVEASMKKEYIDIWEKEHLEMLNNYPLNFDIPHFGAILVLERKD